MLPDFPIAKAAIQKMLIERMKHLQQRALGPLGKIEPSQMHEGKAFILTRQDGSIDDGTPKQIGAEISITNEEVESQNFTAILKKLDSVALEIANGQRKQFFTKFEEMMRETGNTVSYSGEFDANTILQTLDKIELEFDHEGKMCELDFILHPVHAPQMEAAQHQLLNDPEFKNKYDALMAKKFEEWRDRESNRKLVG